MKITAVETHAVGATWKNWLLVRVHTDQGIYGVLRACHIDRRFADEPAASLPAVGSPIALRDCLPDYACLRSILPQIAHKIGVAKDSLCR